MGASRIARCRWRCAGAARRKWPLRWPPAGVEYEARAARGGTLLKRRTVVLAVTLWAYVVMRFGIKVGKPKLDLKAMLGHKDSVVEANVSGVAFLFKKNKIDSFRGAGAIAGEREIRRRRLLDARQSVPIQQKHPVTLRAQRDERQRLRIQHPRDRRGRLLRIDHLEGAF